MTTKYQHGTIEKHKRGTDKPQSQNVGEDILEWNENDYKILARYDRKTQKRH